MTPVCANPNETAKFAAYMLRRQAVLARTLVADAADASHLTATIGDRGELLYPLGELEDTIITHDVWRRNMIAAGAFPNADAIMPPAWVPETLPTELGELFAPREQVTNVESTLTRYAEMAEYIARLFESVDALQAGSPLVDVALHAIMPLYAAIADMLEHGLIHLGQLKATLRNLKFGAQAWVAPAA